MGSCHDSVQREELLDDTVGGVNIVGKYKLSAVQGQGDRLGLSTGSFRIGKRGDPDSVEGRVGEVVELNDDQVEQLRQRGYELTDVDEIEDEGSTQGAQPEAPPQEAASQPDNT